MRNSQAWAETVKSSEATPPSTQPFQGVQPYDSFQIPAPGPENAGVSSINSSPTNLSHGAPSVADLLSQLQATQIPASSSNSTQGEPIIDPRPAPREHSSTPSTSNSSSSHTPPPKQDVRTISFQQSLAHISRLGEDPNVIAELVKVITSIPYQAATSYFCILLEDETRARQTREAAMGGETGHSEASREEGGSRNNQVRQQPNFLPIY